MDVTFKFPFGEVVMSNDGITGTVETNARSKGMAVNRVGVNYITSEGERKFEWFDEDDLRVVGARG